MYQYRAVEKFWKNFYKLRNEKRSLFGGRGKYSNAIHFIPRSDRTRFINYQPEPNTLFTAP